MPTKPRLRKINRGFFKGLWVCSCGPGDYRAYASKDFKAAYYSWLHTCP